jgi:hypothetical protein
MRAGIRNSTSLVLRFLGGALLLMIVGWGVATLIAGVSGALSLTAGVIVLACVLTWLLVHRSHAAHDRSIADTYPSFAAALARRRAEGSIDI